MPSTISAPPTAAPSCACASPRSTWVPGPPQLLLFAIISMVFLGLLLPCARLVDPAWRLLALPPLAAGIALNLFADRAFKVAKTTVKPLLPSTSLVTGGVFRLTRNPMYLGFVLLLLSLWLALGALSPGLSVVLFALLIDRYFVRPEEKKLAATFGDAYPTYRQRVRRWI